MQHKYAARLFLAVCVALTVPLPAPASSTVPDDVYAPIRAEAGTWDADITFFDAASKPQPKHAKGVQINVPLKNLHWITNAFSVAGTPYEGHGVWGYDPVAKAYVDTWVDTNDQAVRTDYGYWDAQKQTMFWSTKQSDGRGHFVDYRMVEEFRGHTRTFSIYQLGMEKPALHPLVKMLFTKRPR